MTHPEPEKLVVRVDQARTVSGLLQVPTGAVACLVLAHGAGAGMGHPFMAAVSAGLAARRIASLRYQFPYMEAGSKRPDSPRLALATVRAAIAQASSMVPALPLIAGGKSFGGRMTSQAQAETPLPSVRGLTFLGFPLHPAKKPSATRAEHLFRIMVPMLFLQGDRDQLAEPPLLHQLLKTLGPRATLSLFPDADHSFHVPVRSGRTDEQVMDIMMDVLATWITNVIALPE
jgi:predicted alpha/beta-hydrolase family hydrolase